MGRVLLVGFGGFLGTVARYTIGGLVVRLKGGSTFPFETLVVNGLGCLVIGCLAGLSETRGVFSGMTRAFLFIGVIGGFTTFSSFAYETIQLLRDGQTSSALWSVGLQLSVGLLAVLTGDASARTLGGFVR